MEIAAASYQVYIGYITDPQLICLCRNESLDQVPVHVIAVVGVGRMPRFRPLLEHVEVSQDAKESIPSGNPVFGKHPLQHQPQLIVADAGIHPADLRYSIYDAHQSSHLLCLIASLLVVRLFGVVKQLAGIFDGKTECAG